MTRRVLPALLLAPVLSLAAPPAHADEVGAPTLAEPPQSPWSEPQPGPGDAEAPPLQAQPTPGARGWPLQLDAHLRAIPGGLSLEVAGARMELRVAGDGAEGEGEPLGPPGPDGHDLRATFSVDGRTTSLLLRIVPPPQERGPSSR